MAGGGGGEGQRHGSGDIAGRGLAQTERRDTHGSDPINPAQHVPDFKAQTETPPNTPTLFSQVTFLIS